MILRDRIVEALKNFPDGATRKQLSQFMHVPLNSSYLSKLRCYGTIRLVRTEPPPCGKPGRVHFYGPALPR